MKESVNNWNNIKYGIASVVCIIAILMLIAGMPVKTYAASSKTYDVLVKEFTSDSRWKNNTTWKGSQSPKLSSYSASGCCAYVADFAKYVFGADSPRSGESYTAVSDIRSGDILYMTNTSGGVHWIVVTYRNGNVLSTVEGNAYNGTSSQKVVVSDSKYTIDGNYLIGKTSNTTYKYTLTEGYHIVSGITLSAPSITSVSNENGGVLIKYGEVFAAEKYRIYRKTGTGNYAVLTETASTSYKDTTVKANTQYTYYVECITSSGSSMSSGSSAKSITYLAAPGNLKAVNYSKNSINGVNITWSSVSGASKYTVERKSGNGSWSTIATRTSTDWIDTTAVSGTTYTYRVRAVNSSGVYSGYSTEVKNTFVSAVYPSLSNTSGGIKITWSSVKGAAKYRVYRKTGSGSWTKLGDTTSTSWTDKTASSGKSYTYTVRCIDSSGNQTAGWNENGKTFLYLSQVSISSLSNSGSKKMTVKWKKVSGASGYEIQYSTSSSFSGAKSVTIKKGTTVNTTIKSLTKNKKYYVRIRAYTTSGGTTYYSAWSSSKNVKISK